MNKLPETYKTIKGVSKGLFRDRGSKFISIAFPVFSVEEVKNHLEKIKNEYRDARHHCYAYQIGADNSIWRANDDGEPSGTAGKPILCQINSHNLTNILIVVVRYFGGTLLGVSGLINAYRGATADAISNSSIISCNVKNYYRIEFPYQLMNEVMKILKDGNAEQYDQVFEMHCRMRIGITLSSSGIIITRLESLKDISINYISTQ